MKRQDNPELKRKILKHLANLYSINEVREANHLSTYVYCRTKAFLSQKQATMPTDEEVMLFSLGYGLQDVLTPKTATTPVYESEGIIYRPDMSFTTEVGEQLIELKTTRRSAKYHFIDSEIPETWLDYMKGGCHLRNTTQYDLIVLYLLGSYSPPFPVVYADTFIFTEEEIGENWQKLLARKQVLDEALSSGQIPEPYKNCYEWECRYCRFSLVCQAISPLTTRKVEEDKRS